MIKFFKDAISEIHNVTWPSRKHIKHISTVAIIFTFSMAGLVWVIDYWFDKSVETVVVAETQFKVSDVKTTPVILTWSQIEVNTETWTAK